jgi:hypothetical protein
MPDEPSARPTDEPSAAPARKRWSRLPASRKAIIIIIGIVAILVGASLGVPGLFSVKQKYHLISFDAAKAYADHQWYQNLGPRMTGSDAELKGAGYMMSQMEAAGLKNVHIEEYQIPLFQIKKAAVSVVPYRMFGIMPRIQGTPTSFKDTTDFVVQGFSGSHAWSSYKDDLVIYDLGNGTDNSSWKNAAGKCGVLWNDQWTPSNTAIFRMAKDFGLAAIAIHNKNIHPEIGYVPIFKGVYFDPGETLPDIPFFMMSEKMGNVVMAAAGNGSKIRLEFDVPRLDVPVRVIVGDVPGSEKNGRYVLVGAHQDTVYNGPGQVDNTSGTVTVLETARMMAKERPRQTIRFIGFGGEEEGLLGSAAYVEAHSADIKDKMIFYENCDMTNIDSSRGLDGWIGSNDNATVEHYKEIAKLIQGDARFARYKMSIGYDPMHSGSDQASFLGLNKKVSFGAGSGCLEYHTYLDNISHINTESEALYGEIMGTYAYYLAENG